MKRQPLKSAPPTGNGSVRGDEVLSLREFGRRLGLGVHVLCEAQRQGLRTVLVGRTKFVLGYDAISWFGQQGNQQAAGGHADE